MPGRPDWAAVSGVPIPRWRQANIPAPRSKLNLAATIAITFDQKITVKLGKVEQTGLESFGFGFRGEINIERLRAPVCERVQGRPHKFVNGYVQSRR
jgi:hypothetical protein